jgi:hypothetical protein
VAICTYVAHSPSDGAFFARRRGLVGLTLNTQLHDVIAANGAVVDNDVPRPEGDGIPLPNMLAFFRFTSASLLRGVLTFLTSNFGFLLSTAVSAFVVVSLVSLTTGGASCMSTSAIVMIRGFVGKELGRERSDGRFGLLFYEGNAIVSG